VEQQSDNSFGAYFYQNYLKTPPPPHPISQNAFFGIFHGKN
jgi:hypothetical protein